MSFRSDERADADHIDHVQRSRPKGPDSANQFVWIGRLHGKVRFDGIRVRCPSDRKKGPTPIISIMFSEVAPRVPTPRISLFGSAVCMGRSGSMESAFDVL